ncbi:SWIM domain-containing protein, partial [Cephalotus follicularis]
YTAKMFELFQKELNDSVSCWSDLVNHEDDVIVYKVGLCDEDKRKWYNVLFDESEGLTLKCECTKFETDGYLCKHILHVMKQKHVTVIPERYIIKRWTIDARYIMDSGVDKELGNEVTQIMKWSLKTQANEAVEIASSSVATYKDMRSLLKEFMGKFRSLGLTDRRFVPVTGVPNEVGSSAIPVDMPGISIRDPQVVRTKGRPKTASRIPSGLSISQKERKKRMRSLCHEKGHYMTTCPNKNKVCFIHVRHDDTHC